ncbi:hypothetical protein DPMN_066575 [Dreissena polymorpha]|uniref:Uncharacterized protein n=1 Tax=Dreissena polymorpha TaxID=45954 RepID=A0A9D4BV48_DREPO|nr:hypothetical protein DPMN_066575 [Dreissena polymorpha]
MGEMEWADQGSKMAEMEFGSNGSEIWVNGVREQLQQNRGDEVEVQMEANGENGLEEQ